MFLSTHTPDSQQEVFDRAKAELRARFACNERPSAAEYLERFEWLRENRDFAVSLIYEEFCLLEEEADVPNPEEFYQRYAPWRDSLEVQLRCHRELRELATTCGRPRRCRHPASPGTASGLIQSWGVGVRRQYSWPMRMLWVGAP